MTLASDILSQRASLIMSEREAASLAAAPIRTAVARWRAALARALSGKRSAVDLQNAQRYAQLLREAGHATDVVVKQFEAIVRQTYATAYGRESFRWASAFEASTGYSFTGIAAREAAIAASGPHTGLSELVSFRNLAGATQTRMASDVATAIVEGWSAKDLVTKWASGAGAGRIYRDAEALARTSLMAASNQAAVAVARQQGKTISGLRWLATFDVRTCPYCGSRHGKVFALDQLPAMPAHLNCRCVWVPVFANVRVEQENRRPTVYRHNPHANAARQKSFETWLRKQPKGHQLDFFGSELKRDLWRRRKVSLDDLTAGARTLTDAELKTLGYHADSFK